MNTLIKLGIKTFYNFKYLATNEVYLLKKIVVLGTILYLLIGIFMLSIWASLLTLIIFALEHYMNFFIILLLIILLNLCGLLACFLILNRNIKNISPRAIRKRIGIAFKN